MIGFTASKQWDMSQVRKRNERRDDKAWRKRYGAALRRAREAKGLTQPQLADKVGVDWGTISGIERGTQVPKLDILEPLADALDLSIDALIGRDRGHHPIASPLLAFPQLQKDADTEDLFEGLSAVQGILVKLVGVLESAEALGPDVRNQLESIHKQAAGGESA